MDLNKYIGREVMIKFTGWDQSILCTLQGITEYGLLVSSNTRTFQNRFYPFNTIQYVDLELTEESKRRVA